MWFGIHLWDCSLLLSAKLFAHLRYSHVVEERVDFDKLFFLIKTYLEIFVPLNLSEKYTNLYQTTLTIPGNCAGGTWPIVIITCFGILLAGIHCGLDLTKVLGPFSCRKATLACLH